ncbi:MAG TPA: T9SS type A sorting domain-containing protein, partial [Caldithrix sp.]|nr:T9SS type A sorting domain-containing protein [Caldithrix sp.]
TGGNATDYLGIYATGDGDSPITDEIFPGGVTQRSDILWGIKEYGDVTADIVFDYSNVAGLSDPSAIQLLLRNDAASAWTNVTAEYTRNDVNRTFSKSGVNDFSEFSIGDGGDNSLPVGLNSFTLTAGNGKVILNWVTESEIGNLGFIILRSTEKDSDYVELDSFKRNDQLKGSGNSSNRREYEYIDETVYNNFTYWYKLVDVSLNGVRTEHAAVSAFPNASGGILNVVNLNIPIEYALHHNYPNPFNPETRIRFDIPKKETGLEELNLSIFNCLGQKVRSLYTGSLSAGVYEVTWEGKNGHGANLPSGIYFLVMKSASFFKIEKMILIR